jgi:hypothetical protein
MTLNLKLSNEKYKYNLVSMLVPRDHYYWTGLMSRWEHDIFKNGETKALEPLKSGHFCISDLIND